MDICFLFSFALFCHVKLEMLLSQKLGWPDLGSTVPRFFPYLIYGAERLALNSSHSQSEQLPGMLEAKSETCSALSLKPEQDYLISLTISLPMWLPWQSPQGKHERSQVSHCLALCAHYHPVHTYFALCGKVRNVLCSKYSSSPYSSELPSYDGMMGLTSGQNTWASFPSCPAAVVSGIPNFWRAARNSKW